VWEKGAHKPTLHAPVWTDVSTSALGGGSPRRLFLHGGKWVLEVVRHVNLGQDLIRPTTQRLTGQRAITSYFKSNPDKASLGKATLRLMANEIIGETRSYTAEGTDWVANSLPPPRGERSDSDRAPAEPPTLETVVGELEAKVVVLTAVQEGLLTRLARLEAKLGRGTFVAAGAGNEERSELRPASSEALAEPDSTDEPASSDADPPSFDGSPEADESDEEAPASASESWDRGDAAEPPPEPAAPPAPPPTPTRAQLELPPMSELAKCVVLLIGGDVSVKEGDPPFSVNRTTKDCYAASILDDNDQTVGAIVMDLKAAVFLGGTLMMLPRSEIEQQLKSLSPGEDSIAASAEICNALSGAINGSQDQHVRAGRLEKFEFKTWSWVTTAADRRDLEDSFGGRTVVFSRPPPVQIS
jgi:hypothetical protein